MIKINDDPKNNVIAELFNLTPKRGDELGIAMKDVLNGIQERVNNGENVSNKSILVGVVELAQTENEQAFCIFQAGMKTQELYEIADRASDPFKRLMEKLMHS